MDNNQNEAIGYICCFIAVIFFGSNFTVVKKFPTGDGFFFQWVMCIGIILVGIFTLLFHTAINGGEILFEPFGMIGGMIWCTGNLLCVPIIQMIGLSLGPAIWGVGNMIMGWLTGTFGFFGLKSDKDTINIFWLNCLGAVFSALSVPFYALIKTSSKEEREQRKQRKDMKDEKNISEKELDEIEMNQMFSISSSQSKETQLETTKSKSSTSSHSSDVEDDSPHTSSERDKQSEIKKRDTQIMVHSLDNNDDNNVEIDINNDVNDNNNTNKNNESQDSPLFALIQSIPKWLQMIVGMILAIISGVLFGSAFNPSKYLQDNGLSSPNGIDYVLSHFLGIFLSSTMYFICYIIVFRNKPFIYKQTILPGMISGIMWGIAQVCWFIANTNLPYVVSYPLICAGPGLLSALWGIVVFGEIRGWKNFLFFGIGTFILIGGIVCICVSK